jgi:hypothetical protein
VLPQTSNHRLDATLKETGQDAGYIASAVMLGDLDPTLHYLSRRSFDPKFTPEAAYQDLFTAFCGREDVAGRLNKGFDLIEQANARIRKASAEEKDPIAAQLGSPELLAAPRVWAVPPPAWVKETLDLYSQATNEMYRAHDNCHPSARKYLFYYCKRGEFSIHYMSSIAALFAAAEAEKKQDAEARLQQLEKAVESLYNALNAMGEVARNQSDRGAIAALNKYAYRPLVKQVEELSEQAE